MEDYTNILKNLSPKEMATAAAAITAWHLWTEARPYVLAAMKTIWKGICTAWPWIIVHGGLVGVFKLTLFGLPKTTKNEPLTDSP